MSDVTIPYLFIPYLFIGIGYGLRTALSIGMTISLERRQKPSTRGSLVIFLVLIFVVFLWPLHVLVRFLKSLQEKK